MAILLTSPRQRFVDANGAALASGKVYTYAAGTTTNQAAYKNPARTTAHANPIILDANGECVVYLSTSLAYKLVVKTSADAEVWTIDDVRQGDTLAAGGLESATATQSLDVRRDEFICVDDFGAIGGNAAVDDSAFVQAAIDYAASTGASVWFGPKTYYVRNLTIAANAQLVGVPGSVLKLFEYTDPLVSDAILANANRGVGGGDSNVRLEGITFDGAGKHNDSETQPIGWVPMVRLQRVDGLLVSGCTFTNYGYIGLSTSASRNQIITGNVFTGLGYQGGYDAANRGPALFCSYLGLNAHEPKIASVSRANPAVVTMQEEHGFDDEDLVYVSGVTNAAAAAMAAIDAHWFEIDLIDDTSFRLVGLDTSGFASDYTANTGWVTRDHPQNVQIIGNRFVGNVWTAVQVSGLRVVVADNVFENNKEVHIYAPHTGGDVAEDYTITGNVLKDSSIAHISGSGMELQLVRATISGNQIHGCGQAGISLSSSRDVTVSGNTIGNCNREDSGSAAINFVMNDTKGLTKNIAITGNLVFDDAATPSTLHAIAGVVGSESAGPTPAANIKITGNNFIGPFESSGNAYAAFHSMFPQTALHASGNSGATGAGLVTSDAHAYAGTFTLPSSGSTPLSQSITGCPFRPSAVSIIAVQASTTAVYESQSFISVNDSGSNNVYGVYSASDGSGRKVTSHLKAVNLANSAGTAIYVADFTAFTDDGFTISCTTLAGSCFFRYLLHP
jgi:parallel beta-helix repeat protein